MITVPEPRTRISPFLGKVLKALALEPENTMPLKNNAEWLNNSIQFNENLYLSKAINEIVYKKLLPTKIKDTDYKRERIFITLIANLLNEPKRPISISLCKKDWTKNTYNNLNYSIVELIKHLKENKYLEMKLGINDKKDSKKSKVTRIWITEKLLQQFPLGHSAVIYRPIQLVLVRDANKKLIHYKENANVRNIRDILEKTNKVNSNAIINCSTPELGNFALNTSLVAIFTRKTTLGGRLYSRGISHYQGLSGENRRDITINGNQTVEVDYRGYHPNLLYAIGIKKQYKGDPYSVIDDRKEVRLFLKIILLCMINSENKYKAIGAADKWLNEEKQDEAKNMNHKKERAELAAIGITSSEPLIKRYLIKHKPIAKYFCQKKDNGLTLMNKDSKIALDILKHFTQEGIPILCIHDSFIVEEKYEARLIKIMAKVYTAHTGFTCELSVKKGRF